MGSGTGPVEATSPVLPVGPMMSDTKKLPERFAMKLVRCQPTARHSGRKFLAGIAKPPTAVALALARKATLNSSVNEGLGCVTMQFGSHFTTIGSPATVRMTRSASAARR